LSQLNQLNQHLSAYIERKHPSHNSAGSSVQSRDIFIKLESAAARMRQCHRHLARPARQSSACWHAGIAQYEAPRLRSRVSESSPLQFGSGKGRLLWPAVVRIQQVRSAVRTTDTQLKCAFNVRTTFRILQVTMLKNCEFAVNCVERIANSQIG
jgi:hypothetical protein